MSLMTKRLRMETKAAVSGILLIISCCWICFGCNSAKSDLNDSIEASIDSLNSYSGSSLENQIKIKEGIIACYDSLLMRYPEDGKRETWHSAQQTFKTSLTHDKSYLDSKILTDSVNAIEIDSTLQDVKTTDSTALTRAFQTLGSYFAVVRRAEDAQSRFLNAFPDDPLADSIKTLRDAIAAKRKSVEYIALGLVSAETMLYGSCGLAGCQHIQEAWLDAIKMDLDMSIFINEAAIRVRKQFGGITERMDKELSEALVCFAPTDQSSSESAGCFAIVENMYLQSRKLVSMSHSPEGSLLSYQQKVSATWEEISDGFELLRVRRERLLI